MSKSKLIKYHNYIKFPIKSIIDKPEEVIPKGYCCTEYTSVGGYECPFLQWRKMTKNRLELFKKTFTNPRTGETKTYYDIPAGNKLLQYCSYLKDYLEVQDCIKDCQINMGYCTEEELDEIMYEATSDGIDEELRKNNDELIKKDIEELLKKGIGD